MGFVNMVVFSQIDNNIKKMDCCLYIQEADCGVYKKWWTPLGYVLVSLIKYYTTQLKLELRSRHEKFNFCEGFVKVLIPLHVLINSCFPPMKEMIIEMHSSPHKSQEPFLFNTHFPFFILQETKEGFASSLQRIRRVVLDLYMVSTTCFSEGSGRRMMQEQMISMCQLLSCTLGNGNIY